MYTLATLDRFRHDLEDAARLRRLLCVNGQYEVPMGGQQKCPLVATKTARSWPTDLPTRGSVASAMKQLSWVSSWR